MYSLYPVLKPLFSPFTAHIILSQIGVLFLVPAIFQRERKTFLILCILHFFTVSSDTASKLGVCMILNYEAPRPNPWVSLFVFSYRVSYAGSANPLGQDHRSDGDQGVPCSCGACSIIILPQGVGLLSHNLEEDHPLVI
ncbi:hypothetical protein BDW75DRAFT_45141 [Aspergillus navahoensis]